MVVNCLVGLAAIGGCSSSDTAGQMVQDANRSNIQRLTNLYTRHQMQNVGQGPKSQAELKKFIETIDGDTLKNMGIELSKIDELFVSERDNQPFDIRYGVKSNFREAPRGLVFETVGVEGVRQVGLSTIAVRDIDNEQQYADLKAGKPLMDGQASSNAIPGVSR